LFFFFCPSVPLRLLLFACCACCARSHIASSGCRGARIPRAQDAVEAAAISRAQNAAECASSRPPCGVRLDATAITRAREAVECGLDPMPERTPTEIECQTQRQKICQRARQKICETVYARKMSEYTRHIHFQMICEKLWQNSV
jgi:hypothetical protein